MVHGTLCRRGVFQHGALVRKPSNLSYAQAATLTCSGLTAWNALMGCKGREIKKGDWVLVHAAAGGVGLAAVQIAKAFGATVIATAGTQHKQDVARSFGADYAIDYRQPDNAARELEPCSV